jgi:starch-binding outer membrane protein, SusD/RagB family
MKAIKLLFILALTFGSFSCHEQYLNPSALTQVDATKNVDGLISLLNGLQSKYTATRVSPVYNYVAASGLSTRCLKVLNPGNTDEAQLEVGGSSVVGSNAIVRNLWEQCNVIKSNSDLVLNNLAIVSDAGVKSGLLGGATIFKALSLGAMASFWEKAPIQVTSSASFSTREEVLLEAIRILENAEQQVAANAIPATFYTKAVDGINVPNTLNALIARYALMLGQYDKAIAAAGKVSLSVKSEFKFNDTNRNPIFDVAFGNSNVFQPKDLKMGLPDAIKPAVADARIDFYFSSRNPLVAAGNTYFPGKGFFTANGSSIPVYLPGEIRLILAEAYARKDDLANATTQLNGVLTKTAAGDAWGLGANLPVYSGATDKPSLLTEIYRNRCIELFLSGLNLEDSRRFGRAAPVASDVSIGERSRNYYPYPATERDNNSSTPADPAL